MKMLVTLFLNFARRGFRHFQSRLFRNFGRGVFCDLEHLHL